MGVLRNLDPHLHHLIQTHPDTGLLEEHIERAMRMLNTPPDTLMQKTESTLWQSVRDEEL